MSVSLAPASEVETWSISNFDKACSNSDSEITHLILVQKTEVVARLGGVAKDDLVVLKGWRDEEEQTREPVERGGCQERLELEVETETVKREIGLKTLFWSQYLNSLLRS